MFAALDVTTADVEELKRMLGRWAAIAARLTAGKQVSDSPVRTEQPPFDTGEAMDLGPHSLTITVGFGPSLFDERFGLSGRMPAELTPFGTIPGDAVMQPAISDGDLCIQACADDPQVVFHAVRNLVRAARGTAVLKWSQLGFGRASATGAGQTTPRNLMGFKDGTQKHPRRRHRRPGRARLGPGRAAVRGPVDSGPVHRGPVHRGRGRRLGRWPGGVDGRRLLPGGAQDPDGDRVVGHRPAHRSGADLRPAEGLRGAADRRRRVHPDRLCEDNRGAASPWST